MIRFKKFLLNNYLVYSFNLKMNCTIDEFWFRISELVDFYNEETLSFFPKKKFKGEKFLNYLTLQTREKGAIIVGIKILTFNNVNQLKVRIKTPFGDLIIISVQTLISSSLIIYLCILSQNTLILLGLPIIILYIFLCFKSIQKNLKKSKEKYEILLINTCKSLA